MVDIPSYNRDAWDREVLGGNPWTKPVPPEQVDLARQGIWSVLLTENIPVPRSWFPAELRGIELLCLASGGGQQGPIFAALGAQVTVFDNSPRQLAQDRMVAERDGLEIHTLLGDMRDLSVFAGESFDLIFHPVSNLFIPDPRPVWREAFRVLRPGGILLSGFMNPIFYIFDWKQQEQGILTVRHSIPYSDLESLSESELAEFYKNGHPVEFGHSLESQIGGQLEAGFVLTDMYEDRHGDALVSKYIATYMATRAVKPAA